MFATAFRPMLSDGLLSSKRNCPRSSRAENGLAVWSHLVTALLAGILLASSTGCLWQVAHEPVIHNPFPQLSRVAVAPFFNQSDEPTVNGREFAMAYFAELQSTPGFEVVPVGVVEDAIITHRIDLSNAGEARRLAQILNVDAVVIGSVTDFTPYYPPRCGMRVEWYAANPGFHEIPPGYGLPWGTPEEEYIPRPLVFEAEFALAKAQMATQTPHCPAPPLGPPQSDAPVSDLSTPPPFLLGPFPPSVTPPANRLQRKSNGGGASRDGKNRGTESANDAAEDASVNNGSDSRHRGVILAAYEEELPAGEEPLPVGPNDPRGAMLPPQAMCEGDGMGGMIGATGAFGALPPNWPNAARFIPPPPSQTPAPCNPYNGPVMTHTRLYNGADGDFSKALANYYHFRTDARFGGWETYLQRSDDFIRFCCHMHICEMLSARGGADETRVLWQWSECR